jgi:putative chitinase
MNLITAAQLRVFAMGCDYMAIAPKLDAALQETGVSSMREVRHEMAQFHVESMGFRRFEENLNYSAVRLVEVWPHRFPDTNAAAPFAMNPVALAEKVYGHRLELGNTSDGDGAKYIGRSPVMITGKLAYEEASDWVGVDLVKYPQQAASLPIACRIAAHWWRAHGLGAIALNTANETPMADIQQQIQANELDNCRAERRVINGGLIGEDEAERQLIRAGFIWKD